MARKRLVPLDFGGPEADVAAPETPILDPLSATQAAQAVSTTAPLPAPLTPERLKPSRADQESGGLVWGLATVAAVIWVLGVLGAAIAANSMAGLLAMPLVGKLELAAVAIMPVGLILFCALLLREGQRLAAHNARARSETARLLEPALAAAAQAGGAVAQVRGEIDQAGLAIEGVRDAMRQFAEMLSAETQALGEATSHAGEAAQRLAGSVAFEREQLVDASRSLEGQADQLTDAVSRQARMVAEAAELAQAQIRESETALSARAADLAAAAGEATDAARAAGGDLSRQTLRLETAARDLTDQVRQVETGLTEQRDSLAELGQALVGHQEGLAERTAAHRQQLVDALSSARDGASEIGQVSAASGQALQALIAAASAQARDIAEAVRIERERMDARARDSFSQLGESAEAERARIEASAREAIEALSSAAEQASQAAELQARVARERVEQLNEAAFDAGRQADEAFETRLSAARRVIDSSVSLVDEAGARSGERLQAGLEAARSSLSELDRALDEIDSRVAALPAAAQARADDVRRAVEEGVEALQDAARRAAAETQAIDAAFQERVRRNYEALSEAVRLMGMVAGGPGATAASAPLPEPVSAEFVGLRPAFEEPEPEQADSVAEAGEPNLHADAEAGAATEALELDGSVDGIDAQEPETAGRGEDEALSFEAPDEPDAEGVAPGSEEDPPSAKLQDEHDAVGGEEAAAVSPDEEEPVFAAEAGPDAQPENGGSPSEAAPAEVGDEASSEPEGQAPTGEAADETLFEPEEDPVSPPPTFSASAEWSWRDVLSEQSADASLDEEALADRLATELQHMSIDADRLLPRSRVEEIAVPVHAGDRDGARAVTQRLAPAALRRLTRRLAADPVMRADAQRFVRAYARLLDDASRKDRAGYMTATLLTSEAGRVWLLMDAAVA